MKIITKFKTIALTSAMMLIPSLTVFAMEAAFETEIAPFTELIVTAMWIISAAFLLFGAIQFGSAFRNDDAEAKSKGLRNLVAGAIALTIAVIAPNLF